MQTIFSRVPTRSSCRCSSCFSLATRTSRRATSAVTRRRLTPGDVFTAFYTTILGTAALVDSKFKDERRKELDEQLAAAREWKAQQAATLEEPNTRSEYVQNYDMLLGAGAAPNSGLNYSPIFDALPANLVKPPAYKIGELKKSPVTWTGANWTWEGDNFEDKLKVLDAHIKQSLLSTSHPSKSGGPSKDRLRERALDEWAGDRQLGAPRQPRRHIHVMKMQEMIAKLVAQLLLTSKSLKVSSTTGADISIHMQRMAAKIEAMEQNQTQLPSYRINDKHHMEMERDGLHTSLKTILVAWTPDSDIELLVAKICYNLLVSTAPPNITTYNMLIEAFTKMKQHELGQHVVDSFFFSSKFKPNSNTVCSILGHYAAKNDAHGFHTVVKRLRAADSGSSHSDMRLKKRPVEHIQNSAKLKAWALTHAVVQRGEYIHQVFLRNTQIADAIIRGYIRVGRIRNAISQTRAAIRLDILDHKTFAHVVEFLPKHEILQARMLLATIKNEFSKPNLPAYRVSEAGFRLAMRRLVSACGYYKSEVENSVIQALMRLIEMEATAAALERLSVCLCHLDVLLKVPPSDSSCVPNHKTVPVTGEVHRISSTASKRALSYIHGYEQIRKAHAKRSDSRRKDCIDVVSSSKALLREERAKKHPTNETCPPTTPAANPKDVFAASTTCEAFDDSDNAVNLVLEKSLQLATNEPVIASHQKRLSHVDNSATSSRKHLEAMNERAIGYEATLRLLLPQRTDLQLEQAAQLSQYN